MRLRLGPLALSIGTGAVAFACSLGMNPDLPGERDADSGPSDGSGDIGIDDMDGGSDSDNGGAGGFEFDAGGGGQGGAK